jgi:hypothetical protein
VQAITTKRLSAAAKRPPRASHAGSMYETVGLGLGSTFCRVGVSPREVGNRADGIETDEPPDRLGALDLRVGSPVKVALGDRHHDDAETDENGGRCRPAIVQSWL